MIIFLSISYILTLSIICKSFNDKTIKIPFISNHNTLSMNSNTFANLLLVEICFGRKSECIYCSLSSQIYHSIFLSGTEKVKGYNKAQSQTYKINGKEFSTFFLNHLTIFQPIVDKIFINHSQPSQIIIDLPFYYIEERLNITLTHGGIIGLKYINTDSLLDNGHGLVDSLYSFNITNSNTFSLVFTTEENGILTIGEKANYTDDNYKSCKVSRRNWNCRFRNIGLFDDFILQKEVFFQFDFKVIHCPMSYFEKIIDIYLFHQIADGYCEIIKNFESSRIICQKNAYENLMRKNSFTFYFDNFTIEITPRDLLIPLNHDKYLFGMVNLIYSNHPWIFGELVFRKHKFYFDKTNERIGFYLNESQASDLEIELFNKLSSKPIIKIILVIISIMLLITITLLIVNKRLMTH